MVSSADLPPVMTNRFQIEASKNTDQVRLTFGYTWFTEGEAKYFTSVIMTRGNARWLCDLIEQQIAEAEVNGRPAV